MLTVSKMPYDPLDDDNCGRHRFECKSCPYQFPLEKRYYERKIMKKKEVEDVMGGAGAWDNVDKTDGIPNRWGFLSLSYHC